MARSFQYIWVAILTLLVVLMAFPLWMFARPALLGISGASGDPTGIGMARFGAGIFAVFFLLIEILFVVLLVRGIRRMRRNGEAQPITGGERATRLASERE